jgi:II/X family phage/plasmid replication protein
MVHQRRQMLGSYDASIHVRSITSETLEISGNPAKFLQGHNLWGPADLRALVERVLRALGMALWPLPRHPRDVPKFYLDEAKLSRIDLTGAFEFGSPNDARAWLRAAHECGRRPYLGQGVFKGTDESTLVYGDATGKRAKAWQLTMYLKGCEIAKRGHRLPEPMEGDERLIDWVNRLVRTELRLRTRELKKRGLDTLAAWDEIDVAAIWADYVEKIQMTGATLDHADLEGVKPRLLDAYDAFLAGRDLRVGRSRGSWYRLRKEMLDLFDCDIAMPPPKSNVVALRRVIVAKPAHRPPWADECDSRLRMIAA